MTLLGATDYGNLAPLVSAAGTLFAAAAAIGLTWRRRARWEPSEEDVAQGPQRVGGVLTAIAIALLWSQARDSDSVLIILSSVFGIVCLVALLAYSFFIQTQTYEIVISSAEGPTRKKVIGGFRLTPNAEKRLASGNVTVQDVLAGSEYDPDKVWTRTSRAFAKLLFIVCYLALTVSGSIALASAAMLVD